MEKLTHLSRAIGQSPKGPLKPKANATYRLTDEGGNSSQVKFLGGSKGEWIFTTSPSQKNSYYLLLERDFGLLKKALLGLGVFRFFNSR